MTELTRARRTYTYIDAYRAPPVPGRDASLRAYAAAANLCARARAHWRAVIRARRPILFWMGARRHISRDFGLPHLDLGLYVPHDGVSNLFQLSISAECTAWWITTDAIMNAWQSCGVVPIFRRHFVSSWPVANFAVYQPLVAPQGAVLNPRSRQPGEYRVSGSRISRETLGIVFRRGNMERAA